MEVIYPRCAGLDLHKKRVVACVMHNKRDGQKKQETRTFGTATGELLQLLAWLQEWECTHVAQDEHRSVLEAGVQHPGRPYGSIASQCAARAERARA